MRDPAEAANDHRRAWDAIAWVVNGRAGAAEQRLVDEHLRVCADCRAELARQRRLQAAIAHASAPAADAEAGLARLLERIDAAPHRGVPDPAARRRARSGAALTHWLVAAVVVEALGLSIMGVGLALSMRSNAAREYQGLSEHTMPAPLGAIRIVPPADMRLGDLQRHLQSLNLSIVSGPNAAGAYALAPRGDDSAAATDARIAQLRAVPGMRLVEPIAAGSVGR